MLRSPAFSVLGPDPTHFAQSRRRTHVLNGNAFQQDAILTFAAWQYACFYATSSEQTALEPVYVHLSRRPLAGGQWQTLVFDDYPQTTDDGHNTVQLGICPGDGTIHLSYDHHCDTLRYRHSVPDLALNPEAFQWTSAHFTPTLSRLPGPVGDARNDPELDALLSYVTYPRFGTLGASKLWFSFRTGKAGLGDDHLAIYDPAAGGYVSRPVTHLRGVDCNPYINGLDCRRGALYATWVNRGFVWYPGWDDPADTKHKAQAGPNSGENNHDLCFAYSEDEGRSWRNGAGDVIVADTAVGSVEPGSPGIRAFEIPRGSGLANQESQTVDHDGGVHVLNRDRLPDDNGGSGGGGGGDRPVRWKHYYRSPTGKWSQTALPHVRTSYGGKRGQVAASKSGDLYFILPEAVIADLVPPAAANTTTATEIPAPVQPQQVLTILRATRASQYTEYQLIWRGGAGAGPSSDAPRFPLTEPLVDRARLDTDGDNVLSVFTRAYRPAPAPAGGGSPAGGATEGVVDVVVLDFDLGSLA